MASNYNHQLPSEWEGDVFTYSEWQSYLKLGMFTPDDGSGYQANELGFDYNLSAFDPKAEDCTHIVWYNK